VWRSNLRRWLKATSTSVLKRAASTCGTWARGKVVAQRPLLVDVRPVVQILKGGRNLLAQADRENRDRGFGVDLALVSMFDRAPPRGDLLIVDDFALDAMDHHESRDVYELIVERQRSGSMIVTSNRDPAEWLSMLADPLRAQTAVDRLKNAAYELVVDGESYRQRQKPR
jgi:hypothetical protein